MLRLTKIWADGGISLRTKLRLLQTLAWSIFSYGCETWTLKKRDEQRIEAFEMWGLRRVLRVSWRDFRTNQWCLDKAGVERQLLNIVKARKLRFYGHVRRNPGLESDILDGYMNGRRTRGRQPTSWTDNIKNWTDGSMEDAYRTALNRSKWRGVIYARTRVR